MAKKKKSERRRRETRFFPQSNANPIAIRVLGAIGAALLGAGAFEQFWVSHDPWKYTPYLLAAGALAFAMSIWFGTSGDLILRIGDGGVGVDRGEVRRIPWYQVSEIFFDPELKAISVKGKDEGGAKLRIDAKLRSQSQAAAWIVKEGRARIPKCVDVSAEGKKQLPEANPNDDVLLLDDLQVVGRKCADSGKAIAYEPDARVCKRCERVYHKNSVPKKCACGASLAELRGQVDGADLDDEEDDDVEEESVDENVVAAEAESDASETTSDEEAT
jgi:hypothetical protein